MRNALSWQALSWIDRAPAPEVLHRRRIWPVPGRDEFVWRTRGPAVIEPEWGYPILEPNTLCTAGFDVLRVGKSAWQYGLPSAREWISPAAARARTVIEVDRVISLRHFYEWNYFHFFFDVVSRLGLLEQLGLLADVPIVLGPSAHELHFAKEVLALGRFADRNWLVQPRGVHIRAQEVLFCRSRLSQGDRARYVVQQLGITPSAPSSDRKVFLVRRPPTPRQIVNGAEIEGIARDLGYEIVDTVSWSVADQIELFRTTRVLVAVHGAGLTNMIFRAGSPMTVVEICTSNYKSEDFRLLAEHLGFGFRRLTFGATDGADPQLADIVVDPGVLAGELSRLDA